jgi:hypothetical protein
MSKKAMAKQLVSSSFFAVLIGLSSLYADSARAGGFNGGGGGALVCKDNSGKILSAELLDLFETRELSQQTIVYDNVTPVEQQVAKAIDKLGRFDGQFKLKVLAAWKQIQTHTTEASDALVIDPPADAKKKFHKEGCSFEGMMYYDGDRQRLFIKMPIFQAQNTITDMAASYMHESIYKVLREQYFDTDSIQTRKITGCLFVDDVASCLRIGGLNPSNIIGGNAYSRNNRPVIGSLTPSLGDCGTTQVGIENRVRDCAALQGSIKKLRGTKAHWNLVTRRASSSHTYETWRDSKTGLIWTTIIQFNNTEEDNARTIINVCHSKQERIGIQEKQFSLPTKTEIIGAANDGILSIFSKDMVETNNFQVWSLASQNATGIESQRYIGTSQEDPEGTSYIFGGIVCVGR